MRAMRTCYVMCGGPAGLAGLIDGPAGLADLTGLFDGPLALLDGPGSYVCARACLPRVPFAIRAPLTWGGRGANMTVNET